MVGWSIFHRHHNFALSLLLAYYGLLRTGELRSLTSSSVMILSPTKPAVVSLGLTKSGKRAGAAESVATHTSEVLRRLYHWKKHVRDDELLVPSPSKWRGLFAECLESLHLDTFSFRPYSLRRGGSTFWFQKHANFDKLLVLGRWQAARAARIYLNEGLPMLTELKLPVKHLRPFTLVYTNALRTPLPKLELTRWVGQGDVENSQLSDSVRVFPFFQQEF